MMQNNYPLIVGVTGGIGSGKSTVASLMAQSDGVLLIDADMLARDAVNDEKILSKIKAHFDNSIFTQDGVLNRKALGKIIFSSPKDREFLNSLTHPYIRNCFFQAIEESASNWLIIYDCPLLFEAGLESDVDMSILVYTDIRTQVEHITQRDRCNASEALLKINAQMDLNKKLSLSDYVIYNDATLDKLELSVKYLINMMEINWKQKKIFC